MNKAIFLDRDGVINELPEMTEDNPGQYVRSWDDIKYCDGAIEGLRILASTGYRLLCVSNQSVVGRGYVDNTNVKHIFDRMASQMGFDGIPIDFFWCIHAPEDNCSCRKPKPGLIYACAYRYHLDLSKCWMIGDSPSDMEAAINAGIPEEKTILIAKEYVDGKMFLAKNLREASDLIKSILRYEQGAIARGR